MFDANIFKSPILSGSFFFLRSLHRAAPWHVVAPRALNALGKQKEKESMEKRQRRQRKDLGMSWDGMGTQFLTS